MKDNSTLNWGSTSTKIWIQKYKCFTLKYVPEMDSFINLLRILQIKKNRMMARASRDIFKVLNLHSLAARAILRTLKTSLVPIYHEMHSRSYDFLHFLGHQGTSKNSILEVSVHLLFPKDLFLRLCI